jgi:hypothetical protein
MSDNDPIAEIDMKDPANFAKAINLALKATDATGWGPMPTKWLHELAGDSEKLWTAWRDSHEGPLVCAVAGNGPKSEANAEFHASARKVVLGLVSEVDRLKTILRNNGIELA